MNDGGPAFPHGPLGDTMHGEDGRESHQFQAYPGMSLRAWLVGQYVKKLISAEFTSHETRKMLIKHALAFADDTIAALANEETGEPPAKEPE